MNATLDKVLKTVKQKYDESACLSFDKDEVWNSREPYIINIEYYGKDGRILIEFKGTSFGQALSRLENFING